MLPLSLFLASCGGEQKVEKVEEPTTKPQAIEEMSEADMAKADQMIKNMPSPIEMAILVKHAGGEYNPSLLNDIKKIDEYVTSGKKTINMGVYSADVGYTSLYKQTQETVFYLNGVRQLSDGIGLTDAFEQSIFDRVEANIEVRDSLLVILSNAYDIANSYLKENDRMNTSALMIAGGWIESVYLAANLGSKEDGTEDIIALRILEQEVVLGKIIKTMRLIENDPLVAEFADKLEDLSTVLVEQKVKIGEGEHASVDEEKMKEVVKKINEIRAWAVA